MKPRVIHCHSLPELKQELEQSGSGMAVVFSGSELLNEGMIDTFSRNGVDVFGTMSSEEIADGQVSTGSVSGLLFHTPPTTYQIRHFDPEGKDSKETGREIADWTVQQFASPVLLLLIAGAGLKVITDDLLEGIFSRVNPDRLPVYGALASRSDDDTTKPACVFSHTGIFEEGVLALTLDSEYIAVDGLAFSGWQAIGTPKKITKSKANRVYEIDTIPALDFYKNYFQVDAQKSSSIIEAGEYPIQIRQSNGNTIMRTAVAVDPEDQSILYGGNISQGSLVRFCAPNIVPAIYKTVDEMQNFRDQSALRKADAILLFDCAIRSRSFGSFMKKEVAVIRDIFSAPMAGFSSWGEIGTIRNGMCALHNTVISMLIFRQKDTENADNTAFTNSRLSEPEIEERIHSYGESTDPKKLIQETGELRKQKNRLSNFLLLTSNDLEQEQAKSEGLLRNILPAQTAERLKSGERVIADRIESATVVFADITGFTTLSDTMDPARLVRLLNRLFSSFDEHAVKCRVEKIKTIGDAYMAVSGLPQKNPAHATHALQFALGMLRILKKFNIQENLDLNLRVGLNTGPVVAGVIGRRKFSYDVWGDSVNVASRMESHGIAGQIHLSDATYRSLPEEIRHRAHLRGETEIKGKGPMITWLIDPDHF